MDTNEHASGLQGRQLPTPCRNCRYELGGLPDNSACPECNTPVEQSLVVLLRRADPNYLAQLRTGAGRLRVLVWLIVGYLLLGILGLITYALLMALGSPRLNAQLEGLLLDAATVFTIGGWVVGLIFMWFFASGWWNVSAELPSGAQYDQPKRRKMLRVSLVIYLVFYVITLVLSLAALAEPLMNVVAVLPNLVSSVVYFVLLFAMGPLVESIALRVPDERTAKTARSFHWFMRAALVALLAGATLGAAGAMLIASIGGVGAIPLMFIGMLAFIILSLIAFARYCSMCLNLYKAVNSVETEI